MLSFVWWHYWSFDYGIFPYSAKEDKNRLIFKYIKIGWLEIRIYKNHASDLDTLYRSRKESEGE